jgi:cupin superfamily acireductone dioxygenase involved in methionine salvage
MQEFRQKVEEIPGLKNYHLDYASCSSKATIRLWVDETTYNAHDTMRVLTDEPSIEQELQRFLKDHLGISLRFDIYYQ